MISTKNIPTSSGTPKIIQPGNVECKINSITLESVPYKEGAYHVCLHLETKPIEEDTFEGLLVDKDNPNGPRYAGQVARIKTSEWAYSDGETKSGLKISRDTEIVKMIQTICREAGCSKWLEENDNVYNTIEEFVSGINSDKPFKDKYLKFCIGAREYTNKAGYQAYDLHLVKTQRGQLSIQSADSESVKLITFNPELHIKKSKSETVTSFNTGSDFDVDVPTTKKVSADFDL
ncbi:MAG: hypothetical protein EBU90_05550 [Proteobacteria bacterium]|jgi:hypothetical protein|nr:hypothetical protein [Pseudomonadota bacterium]NBP13648.1 hypothetical protein [bacterium]